MPVTEYDLFKSNVYAGDNNVPIIICDGCGCLVANTWSSRANHVEFHNNQTMQ